MWSDVFELVGRMRGVKHQRAVFLFYVDRLKWW